MGYMGHGSLKGSIRVDTSPLWWRCERGRMAGIHERPALTAHYHQPRSATIRRNTPAKIGDFLLCSARTQRFNRAQTSWKMVLRQRRQRWESSGSEACVVGTITSLAGVERKRWAAIYPPAMLSVALGNNYRPRKENITESLK